MIFRLLLAFLPLPFLLPGQSPAEAASESFVTIQNISLEGNKKTKPAWILRELEFSPGDSLPMSELGKTLERNRLRLMNTGLFSNARINVKNWEPDNCVDLHLILEETWYIYPIPIFGLSDRNFNVWWDEFDHDFSRTYYGLDLQHFNLTGRADLAKLGFELGYAEKFNATYSRPGINKSQTLGLNFGFSKSRQRETSVKTEGNKLVFFQDRSGFQIQKLSFNASLVWRPKLLTIHTLTLQYFDNQIADTIARDLNPDFFLHGNTRQKHWSLLFNVERDRRDIRPYPLHGYFWRIELRKNGLLPDDDFHLFRLTLAADKYFSFSEKLSLETNFKVRTSFTKQKVPYFNNQALGYADDFVRGFEYYVSDGLDFGLAKVSLHHQIFNHTFDFGKFMPLESFRLLPIRVYLAANNDFGFANDPNYSPGNPLSNRLLWGCGLGLHVVGYYSRVALFEVSRNDLGEIGFFLRMKSQF